jgi:hypothetical protein
METMGEQDTFALQALVSRRELDFGDGESVTKVQGAIHVRVREVTKPFGIALLDFSRGQAREVLLGGCVGLEETVIGPSLLVFFLKRDQIISFGCLERDEKMKIFWKEENTIRDGRRGAGRERGWGRTWASSIV